jgi:Predicted ATPase
MNEDLKHITVLEEAHNLLRRTASEQTQESSNLQGKSVEMLANAIAEMRTYGEGFIIADQSPGLMDMSVIRNTNTKIIMRLPDESDRILVGRAASLNDSQISELARLERGVAAVFQNDWLEPVLCKVDLFDDDHHSERKPFTYQGHGEITSPAKEKLFKQILFGSADCEELSAEEVDEVKCWIDYVDLGRAAKDLLLKTLHSNEKLTETEQGFLLYCLIKGKDLIQQQLDYTTSPDAVQATMNSQISDRLSVSLPLAEEIRKRVFLYAAHQVEENTVRYDDLLYYGGVR